MSKSVPPDGSIYVVVDGQLKLLGVYDASSWFKFERGIRSWPGREGFMVHEPDGRIHISADLAEPENRAHGDEEVV